MSEADVTIPPSYDRTLWVIEWTGVALVAIWAILLAAFGILRPDPYAGSWQLVLGQLVVGRAYSVSAGLNGGFSKLFLLTQCSLQDIVTLFLLYPVLVAGYRRVIEVRFVGPALANIRATAERHKSRVAHFGAVGVMVFVFFPLWCTGALAGALIGYLLGMHTAVVFTSVIVGNILAVACWIWLFDVMRGFSERLGDGIPVAIVVSVVVFAAVFRILDLRRRAKRRQRGDMEQ